MKLVDIVGTLSLPLWPDLWEEDQERTTKVVLYVATAPAAACTKSLIT